jgi:hypothetical protein
MLIKFSSSYLYLATNDQVKPLESHPMQNRTMHRAVLLLSVRPKSNALRNSIESGELCFDWKPLRGLRKQAVYTVIPPIG